MNEERQELLEEMAELYIKLYHRPKNGSQLDFDIRRLIDRARYEKLKVSVRENPNLNVTVFSRELSKLISDKKDCQLMSIK